MYVLRAGEGLLLLALHELLLEKSLRDITVSELCNRSGVGFCACTACRESYVKLNSDEEREYAALFMSAGLSCLTQSYIRRHEQPDGAELARLSHKLMSGSIYRR